MEAAKAAAAARAAPDARARAASADARTAAAARTAATRPSQLEQAEHACIQACRNLTGQCRNPFV